MGLNAENAESRRRIERDVTREATASRLRAELESAIERGGVVEAFVRAQAYILVPTGEVDDRAFVALQEIRRGAPPEYVPDFAQFREVIQARLETAGRACHPPRNRRCGGMKRFHILVQVHEAANETPDRSRLGRPGSPERLPEEAAPDRRNPPCPDRRGHAADGGRSGHAHRPYPCADRGKPRLPH